MQIKSAAFNPHEEIPIRFTCEGEDISPELRFIDAPQKVKSFALIVEDPDAPRGLFIHWLAWNIPADSSGLEEGAKAPLEGTNDFGNIGYGGPCPPPGKAHRYYFRLFALDQMLALDQGASKDDLLDAMKGHILAESELMGTYAKRSKI